MTSQAHNPEVVGSNPTPATSYLSYHQRLGESQSLSRFHLEAVRGRNQPPNDAPELICCILAIFSRNVRVDPKSDTGIAMAESLLTHLHGNAKVIHQRRIRMAEGVKAIPFRDLDIERLEKRSESALTVDNCVVKPQFDSRLRAQLALGLTSDLRSAGCSRRRINYTRKQCLCSYVRIRRSYAQTT